MPVANAYQQAVEPTDLTPGVRWFKDDGKAYIRKLDLTWNYIGEWELPNMHHLHLEGGTMLGPILGAHGLAPTDSPAFTGTPTLGSVDLADKQWTTDQLTALLDTVNKLISNQFGGGSGNLTIGNNMAVGYGTVADQGTIPLPVYADNKRAVKAEVWGLLVSQNSVPHSSGSEATNWINECFADVNLLVTCKTRITSGGGGSNAGSGTSGVANYIIACKR